jgi:hypothetical protein
MCEADHNFEFQSEDFDAVAALLYQARTLLESLDLNGVAGALDLKQFTLVPRGRLARPTIACAQCNIQGEKEASA